MGKQLPKMKVCDALDTVGGLSAPSKMPSYGWSIPAKECLTGSKLREVPNSVCSGCYAMGGRYTFPNVEDALYRRFNILMDAIADDYKRSLFVSAFAFLLNKRQLKEFRWHDSGDLQCVAHLKIIVEIAQRTPDTDHWLPCREYRIVLQYIKSGGTIPQNLNIRLSAHMIDGEIPTWAYEYGMTTSGVTTGAGNCHAQQINPETGEQFGNCGPCRRCWDRNVDHVIYHKH